MLGEEILAFAKQLYPICRSITGPGVRETLRLIKEHIPELAVSSVSSGTQCFDWTVPKEWAITDAYLLGPDGSKILDFKESNLHVVGYSIPVNRQISLEDLQAHLHSLPDQPNAIPYITSYYKDRWGFCLTHNQRMGLKPGLYTAVIDSRKFDGVLNYAEVLLPGASAEEVFISTYVCHPSMANNELSGPAVVTFLVKWLRTIERRFTYRIVFIPETIGSIVYLSRHLQALKSRMVAGFNVSCIGDDRTYSYLPSRLGGTLSDRVAIHVLSHTGGSFKRYSYLDRGSDERQYCSPGVDLPVASIMRSKYAEYPEYHTSLDDFTLVTASGLEGGFNVLRRSIECLEMNRTLAVTTLCEPQLGKRGLYPTLSTKEIRRPVSDMMNLIAYCDGTMDTLAVAEKIGVPLWALKDTIARLSDAGVLKEMEPDAIGDWRSKTQGS